MGNRIRSMKPNITNYYVTNVRNQYTSITNDLGGFVGAIEIEIEIAIGIERRE